MRRILPFLIVLAFGFFSVLSLFHPGLPPTHDGEYHVVRFYEFNKTLLSGQLYPRWAPDLNKGYGSPILNYYYQLPNYFASFLHLLGLSFIDSFKIELILATLFGGLLFFLWARIFWGTAGGVISSVLYIYSPYRLVDIFIRGSVGEVLALCFFPGFLWSITEFVKRRERKFFVFSVLLLSLVIFSHNILAYMFFSFAILYTFFILLINKVGKKTWIFSTVILLLSIGIAGIFWVPALFERHYVQGLEIFDYKSHFPELYQLLFPSWGTGFSNSDLGNEMSFQLGVMNLISVFFGIASFFILKEKNLKKTILFFITGFSFVLFLMLKNSLFLWEYIPFLNYFQFPWRLLSLEIIITSFLGGSLWKMIVSEKSKTKGFISLVIFAICTVIVTSEYIKPAYFLERSDDYYITESDFIDSTNTPGNALNVVGFNSQLKRTKEKISFISDSGVILSEMISPTRYIFNVNLKNNTTAVIQTAYFPAWRAKTNKGKINLTKDENGLIKIDLNSSVKSLEIFFTSTVFVKAGEFLSAFSLISLIFVYHYFRKTI
ncbi:MAG: hypothetical protein A3J14_01995 [Candidatus Levybacteria bacterium RIFCSPLOWO2_02_FULL_37_18]|nr:MAG: hypothetical protein A3J14_01995 [Candidatus Levybacteria bacterium RIFCSPLOWO2_02_FULL_37_18]